jgi:hypothetical protein
MDAYTIVRGRGGGLPTTPHPLKTSSHNSDARRPSHPSYTQQHTATLHNSTRVHKTTVPMYQLFLWRLFLMVLRGAPLKTITYRAIKTTGTLIVIRKSMYIQNMWRHFCYTVFLVHIQQASHVRN